MENELQPGLSAIQQEALEKSTKELEAYRKELETKKYLADIGKTGIDALVNFIKLEAPWKFTESIGIKEVYTDLLLCAKNGKLFLNALAFEALYFYLSRVEGKGLTVSSSAILTVDEYLDILKNINIVRNVIAQENEKLKGLEFIVASRAEGIEPESEAKA
jgi:hypothetical protein